MIFLQHRNNNETMLTMSVSFRCRSNSDRTQATVSFRVAGFGMAAIAHASTQCYSWKAMTYSLKLEWHPYRAQGLWDEAENVAKSTFDFAVRARPRQMPRVALN